MGIPMKEPLLIDPHTTPDPSAALVRQPELDVAPAVSMFERLAKDPTVDVEKLERLISMQERILHHQAKAEFDEAFARMQGEIPEINEEGQIIVNGELRSKYARNEDIQRVVKPILQRHGFSIRFRNEWLDGGKLLKTVGILTHRSGHSESDEFVAAADTSGSKNAIQALGSTRHYGQRYTTVALLNIATRGDDDGQSSEQYKAPERPDGYENWLLDMTAAADEGWPKLSQTFQKSRKDYRDFAVKHDKSKWEGLKAKAQKASQRA